MRLPLSVPPLGRPRARSCALVGRESPVSCQFAVVPARVPLPSGVQLPPPFVLNSKVTCETSGAAPSRFQRTLEVLGIVRFASAGVLVRRAQKLRTTNAPLGCSELNLP